MSLILNKAAAEQCHVGGNCNNLWLGQLGKNFEHGNVPSFVTRIEYRTLKGVNKPTKIRHEREHLKLEGCMDDERQFKTAKRSQVSGDATVLKRFFRDTFVTFRLTEKNSIFGICEFFYVYEYATFQFS